LGFGRREVKMTWEDEVEGEAGARNDEAGDNREREKM
jgi:hypothetical protein